MKLRILNALDWSKIEKLASSSSIDVDFKRLMYMEQTADIFNEDEYNEEIYRLIEYLVNNQLDPITHGRGYNQTDIKNHLKKLR